MSFFKLSRRRVFGLLLMTGLFLFTFWGLHLLFFAYRPLQPELPEPQVLEVTPGMTRVQIIAQLEKRGILKHPLFLLWLGKATHAWNRMKAGEYEISGNLSPLDLFAILESGKSILHPFTLKEGENLYEVTAHLATTLGGTAEEWVSLCKNQDFMKSLGFFPADSLPESLEGYLYPETYFFTRATPPREVLQTFVKTFFQQWKTLSLETSVVKDWPLHRIVTLASIIEKETGAAEERFLVSSVFHNRLKKKMRLQSDPTTIYGMGSRYDGKIRKKDLLEKTPYNTYQIDGLPPGPIANPGKEALRATLQPASTQALFFVSRNNGTHEFNVTYEGHVQAVRKYQLGLGRDPGPRQEVGKE